MTEQRQVSAFHDLPSDEALNLLHATAAGLGSEEAAVRLHTHGRNCLLEPPRRSTLLRFLGHFHNVLIYVLIAAAVVTAALQHWVDTGVILAVVFVNAVIGFVQEGRAEQECDVLGPAVRRSPGWPRRVSSATDGIQFQR
ncbi:MAG TPA: cation-transporting P-type ATPase [Aurantimonas sp.]